MTENSLKSNLNKTEMLFNNKKLDLGTEILFWNGALLIKEQGNSLGVLFVYSLFDLQVVAVAKSVFSQMQLMRR